MNSIIKEHIKKEKEKEKEKQKVFSGSITDQGVERLNKEITRLEIVADSISKPHEVHMTGLCGAEWGDIKTLHKEGIKFASITSTEYLKTAAQEARENIKTLPTELQNKTKIIEGAIDELFLITPKTNKRKIFVPNSMDILWLDYVCPFDKKLEQELSKIKQNLDLFTIPLRKNGCAHLYITLNIDGQRERNIVKYLKNVTKHFGYKGEIPLYDHEVEMWGNGKINFKTIENYYYRASGINAVFQQIFNPVLNIENTKSIYYQDGCPMLFMAFKITEKKKGESAEFKSPAEPVFLGFDVYENHPATKAWIKQKRKEGILPSKTQEKKEAIDKILKKIITGTKKYGNKSESIENILKTREPNYITKRKYKKSVEEDANNSPIMELIIKILAHLKTSDKKEITKEEAKNITQNTGYKGAQLAHAKLSLKKGGYIEPPTKTEHIKLTKEGIELLSCLEHIETTRAQLKQISQGVAQH